MNYDLMDHGRYFDGSSPDDPTWAGGIGGKGARDGLTPAQLASPPRQPVELATCHNDAVWPFPTGGFGFLG